MKYLFPVAFMANTFAMSLLMIILSLAGNSGMAAEVGILAQIHNKNQFFGWLIS